jgi:hypothetical protein
LSSQRNRAPCEITTVQLRVLSSSLGMGKLVFACFLSVAQARARSPSAEPNLLKHPACVLGSLEPSG